MKGMTRAEFVRQARVLLVDDDEACRNLMAEILKPMGCVVGQAEGGRAALELLATGGWDLVVLDLNMPGISGFDTLARIRETHPVGTLPVLMSTGQDDMDTRLEALRLGANDFIAKPLHYAEVMARLGTMLAMHW